MYKNIKFSLWCDFVERSFLDNEFEELLNKKIVNGATSNPAIFKSAFLTSNAYKEERNALKGKDAKEVYEILAIKDIQKAADKMTTLYESGDDGFISFEVDPHICNDSEATIKEGKRLFATINRANVMIKVPATDAGYIAMSELLSSGINVNATLIFSPIQAQKCAEAFKNANKKLENKNLPKAVISVFVSRLDSKLDSRLKQIGIPEAKAGVLNATKIYDLIESYNLKNVRTLFASTGVKRDDLPADYYIKELLFKNSINTAPLGTIKEFIKSNVSNEKSKENYENFFTNLAKNNINIVNVYDELMSEGLSSFKDAFAQILKEL